MSQLKRVVCFVAALMLAAFALPGIAANQSQNKTYTITMNVISSTQLQATFLNTSPRQSSSTFGSVDMFVDVDWTIDLTSVSVTLNGTPTGSVNLSSPPGHIQITAVGPVKPGDSLVVTFNLLNNPNTSAPACGDASWDADVWSGSNIGSGNFFTNKSAPSAELSPIACATVACTGTTTFTANGVSATREPINKDGTSSGDSCGGTTVFVSNTSDNNVGLNQNVVHFRWLQAGQNQLFSTAVFLYTITFATSATNVQVGWRFENGDLALGAGADPNATPNNPVAFIAAPNCLTSVAPFIYGILKQNITASDTTIKVDTGTSSPPAVPAGGLPITIGTERILIASITSSGWQVAPGGRGAGGTIAANHSKNDPAVSTPLPTLDAAHAVCTNNPALASCPYFEGEQAQMCLVGTSGNTATLYDFGDGWGTH